MNKPNNHPFKSSNFIPIHNAGCTFCPGCLAFLLTLNPHMPSSVVASFSYAKNTSVLKVVFVSGAIYEYLDVPEEVYAKMMAYTSKGTYLNTHVKGKYNFRKLRKGDKV